MGRLKVEADSVKSPAESLCQEEEAKGTAQEVVEVSPVVKKVVARWRLIVSHLVAYSRSITAPPRRLNRWPGPSRVLVQTTPGGRRACLSSGFIMFHRVSASFPPFYCTSGSSGSPPRWDPKRSRLCTRCKRLHRVPRRQSPFGSSPRRAHLGAKRRLRCACHR